MRNQTLTALSLVMLMMLSSILPGCIESTDEVEEEVNPNAAPKEAMGMWWPTVDGIIESPTISPHTEWSDGDQIEIDFLDDSGSEHAAILRYKSVEEGLALAVEIDKLDETPQKIVLTLPDRELTIEVTTESAFDLEMEMDCSGVLFECPDKEEKKIINKNALMEYELLDILWKNEVAAIHNLDTDKLVMESTAKQLFDDTTEVSYTISVIFSESTWTFEKTTDFGWVLPYLFPRSDISVTGIEVTQAVQTADMQMRLVEGKTSLARVYVDSGDLATANVEVTLKYCILIFCVDELTKTHVAVQSPDRADFSHSANFVLPDHWVTYEGMETPIAIGLIATIKPIYPDGFIDYLDPDTSNNYDAGVFWFNQTRDLIVWAVRIPQDTNGDGISEFRPQATVDQWMDYTGAMLPTNLNQVDFTWTTMPDMAGCTVNQCNGQLWNWSAEMSMIIAFSVLLGSLTGEDIEGLPPLPDQVHGITPLNGMGGGVSSPAWCTNPGCSGWSGEYGAANVGKTSSLVSVCGDAGPRTVGNQSQQCVVHEMTHNLGPYCMDNSAPLDGDCIDATDEAWGAHLAQCGAGGSDAVWATNFQPYNIKDIGWDPLANNPETNQQALVPPGYPDFMSYCGAGNTTLNNLNGGSDGFEVPYVISNDILQWISTMRWEWMYDKFENWSPGNPANPYNGRSSEANSTYRTISGIVPADGSTASLGHSWTDSGVVSEFREDYSSKSPERNYTIRVLDSSSSLIQEIKFDPVHINPEGEVIDHHISYVLNDNGLINSIELLHRGTVIDSLRSTSSPVTRMLPLDATEYSRDRPVNLSWTKASSSSNLPTLYQLGYSSGSDLWLPIGGLSTSTTMVLDFSTLPATLQGKESNFRVRATNGFDTYYSESSSFTLPNQAPELTLETSGAIGLHDVRKSILAQSNQAPMLAVTAGDSFSITPSITDADWTSINEKGCTAVLKRGQETVWSRGDTAETETVREINRITSHPSGSQEKGDNWQGDVHGQAHSLHDSVHCLHNNGAFLPYSFPNKDILPGEMTPGDYVFEMTYVDVGGASVTEKVSFSVIHPDYLVGPDSTGSADDILQEYRANLEMMSNISKMNNDLNRGELQYYLELSRNARGDDDALTDAEITELQKLYGISDSRAEEIAAMD